MARSHVQTVVIHCLVALVAHSSSLMAHGIEWYKATRHAVSEAVDLLPETRLSFNLEPLVSKETHEVTGAPLVLEAGLKLTRSTTRAHGQKRAKDE